MFIEIPGQVLHGGPDGGNATLAAGGNTFRPRGGRGR